MKKGDRVLGNFGGEGEWYEGTITKVSDGGLYDIAYDDGDSEKGVSASNVKAIAKSSESGAFKEGDRVLGNFGGEGEWYEGTITKVSDGGLYDIAYDDGDSEKGVSASNVKAIEKSPQADGDVSAPSPKKKDSADVTASSLARQSGAFKKGDRVLGNFGGEGEWYEGTITKVSDGGLYDIAYDDGDSEKGVSASNVKAMAKSPQADGDVSAPSPKKKDSADVTVSSSARQSGVFKKGDRVLGNFGGEGEWYEGTITKVSDGGLYDIAYDDGDSEKGVSASNVKAIAESPQADGDVSAPSPKSKDSADVTASSSARQSGAFKKGDRVLGNFGGEGEWYEGTITKVSDGGLYDIAYDDGDSEKGVSASNVKAIAESPQADGDVSAPSPKKKDSADVTASSSARQSGAFKKGDRVLGNFGGEGEWYEGTITKVSDGGLYDIAYDDGDSEKGVSASNVKAMAKSPQADGDVSAPSPKKKDSADVAASSSARQSGAFKEGDRVLGNFGGEGEWYEGTITKVSDGGLYDIAYDDGDSEKGVSASNVKAMAKSPQADGDVSAPSPKKKDSADVAASSSARHSGVFKEGDRVLGNFGGEGEWYEGTITKVSDGGLYDIAYDDGDSEKGVSASNVKAMAKSPQADGDVSAPSPKKKDSADVTVSSSAPHSGVFKKGDRVLGNFGGEGEWYEGTITKVSDGGLYDIAYDDGDSEKGVSASNVKAMAKSPQADGDVSAPSPKKKDSADVTVSSSARHSGVFKEGDRVLGNFGGEGEWYEGTITKVSDGGLYDIAYDDGDSEKGVSASNVKAIAKSPESDAFKEGDRVLGNFGGEGEWYEGTITKVSDGGLYDIAYDDGDSEKGVSASNVKAIAKSPESGAFKEGDRVLGNFGGEGEWYEGTITKVSDGGLYDIAYDDGDSEKGVSASNVKAIAKSSESGAFKEGDRVLGNFGGEGEWYEGTITKVSDGGLYDIAYDDGDSEKGVSASNVKAIAKSPESGAFKEGDRVLGNFGGEGEWYEGTITKVSDGGLYDIAYDDGDSEKGVSASNVKAIAKSSESGAFKEGDRVLGNFGGEGEWYEGTITKVSDGGLYDIAYDDGDSEKGVSASNVKAIAKSPESGAFKEGDRVLGNFGGEGEWYEGTITKVSDGGLYDIAYDDGDSEKGVSASNVKAIAKSSESGAFKEGDRVLGNFGGEGEWYEGTITKVSDGGLYDIAYDDGDSEKGVSASNVKAIAKSPESGAFKEGDRVLGNFGGEGEWYEGTITKVSDGGLYDIAYDDGDSEKGVSASNVKAIEKSPQADGDVSAPSPKSKDSADVTASSSARQSGVFKEGDRVLGNFGGEGEWYEGTITKVSDGGLYDIAYDDGDSEKGVSASNVKAIAKSSESGAFKEGDRVLGNLFFMRKKLKQSAVDLAGFVKQKFVDDPEIFNVCLKKFLSAVVDKPFERRAGGLRYPMNCLLKRVQFSSHNFHYYDTDEDDQCILPSHLTAAEFRTLVRNLGINSVSDQKINDAFLYYSEKYIFDDMIRNSTILQNNKFLHNKGDKVLGNFGGEGEWYEGTITKVSDGGLYDIAYDDGDSEKGVSASNVKAIAKSPESGAFKEGDRVLGNFGGEGEWYEGTITKVSDGGLYDIAYDDGDSEKGVSASNVKAIAKSPESDAFKEGDRVLGNFGGEGEWYEGTITKVSDGGLYDIAYDDGDSEKGVSASNVKAIAKSPESGAFKEGDRVLGNFGGEGEWYEGTITKVSDGGLYDIAYDDGDSEKGVSASNVKAIAKSPESDAFKEGDRVLGNFGGEGEWYEGTITKVSDGGLYDIAYDDGDSEKGVSASNVKARSRNDDLLSLEDLISFIREKLIEASGGAEATLRRMKNVFADLDTNDSGTLDLNEFRRGLETLGVPINEKESMVVFRKFDASGDGTMSYVEFVLSCGFVGDAEFLFTMDIRHWMKEMGLSRSSTDIFESFCSCVHHLLCEIQSPVGAIKNEDETLTDLSLVVSYFSCWSTRSEYQRNISDADFQELLSSLGLFVSIEEMHALKETTDCGLIMLTELMSAFESLLEEKSGNNQTWASQVKSLLLRSDACGHWSPDSVEAPKWNIIGFIQNRLKQSNCFSNEYVEKLLLETLSVTSRDNVLSNLVNVEDFQKLCCVLGFRPGADSIRTMFADVAGKESSNGIEVRTLLRVMCSDIEGMGHSNTSSNFPEYMTVTQFTSAVCRVLLSPSFREKMQAVMETGPPPKRRIRKSRRVQAIVEGHMGGEPVLTTNSAAINVQRTYRGWQQRKLQKRKHVAATEIQRVFRGKSQKLEFQKKSSGLSDRLYQEKERASRLRRIRAQEKELAMLRHLPIQDFLNFDRLRKGGSAKVIQRCWRRNRGIKFSAPSPSSAINLDDDISSDDAELRVLRRQLEHARQLSSPRTELDNILDYESRSYPDAIQLMELLDRVKLSAKRKSDSTFGEKHGLKSYSKPSSRLEMLKDSSRRKYTDYFQSRQRAAVIVEDYMLEKENWRGRHHSRVAQLNRCKRLLKQCSNPLPLQEARKAIVESNMLSFRDNDSKLGADKNDQHRKVNDFASELFEDLPPLDDPSYLASTKLHQQTMKTYRQDSKWGLINIPSVGSTSGAKSGLINLCNLDYDINDVCGSKMKNKTLNSDEESIAWITYACRKKSGGLNMSDPIPKEADSLTALDKVDCKDLLQKSTRRVLISRDKRQAGAELVCARVLEQRDRLADAFTRQALVMRHQSMIDATEVGSSKFLSYEEVRKKNATKIQAAFRGKKGREHVRHMKAESRVMAALRVLVSELTQPDLQGKQGPSSGVEHLLGMLGGEAEAGACTLFTSRSKKSRESRQRKHPVTPPMSYRSSGKEFEGKHETALILDDSVSGAYQMPVEKKEPQLYAACDSPREDITPLHSTPRHPSSDKYIDETMLSPLSTSRKPGKDDQAFAEGYVSSPSMTHSELGYIGIARASPASPRVDLSNGFDTFDEKNENIGMSLKFSSDEIHQEVQPVERFAAAYDLPVESSIRMMKNVEKKVRQGRTLLSVSGLLDIGLTVSAVDSFKKDVAYGFMLQLCICYGPVCLVQWLQSQPPLHPNNEVVSTRESQDGLISVEAVVLYLGELGVEIGILNEAINRISGEEDDAESINAFCEFCMLVKLVSAGSKCSDDEAEVAMVPLWDLQCIMEEEWLKFVPENGLRFSKLLAHCRSFLMHESRCKGFLNTSEYFRQLTKQPTSVMVTNASGEESVKLGGLHEIMRRAGIDMTLSDAGTLLSICAWPAYSSKTNVSASIEVECLEVSLSRIEKWICALGSYRHIQSKMRVYMKALNASQCLDLLKGIQHDNGKVVTVSKNKFASAVAESNAPLSRAESLALGELLMRRKPSSGTPKKRASRKRGGWSWLIDDDIDFADNDLTAERNVDVMLLDRIYRGDFLSAVL